MQGCPGTACLEKREYDLLLTDIQMPGTDGFSVLELLRASDVHRARGIPAIAVTARPGDKEEFLSAGFAGCLYKPFSEDELLAAVSYTDRTDFAAILEGEENRQEMLEIFIEDTTEELAGMRDAFSTGNYEKLRGIIHKAAPLWEMIRIGVPGSELKRMAAMPPGKWDKALDGRIEQVIEAVERVVKKAKGLKGKADGRRTDSRG